MIWEEMSCHDAENEKKRHEQEPTTSSRKILEEQQEQDHGVYLNIRIHHLFIFFFYLSHLAKLNPREFDE